MKLIVDRVLIAAVSLFSVTAALDGPQIARDLRPLLSPRAGIFLPADIDWANKTTQRFDAWNAPTYTISVRPAGKDDIRTVVKYAARNSLPFLTTGGGHGYSGSLGALRNGIELDMSFFNNVTIDKTKSLMTVGGAVRFSDLMDPCYNAGKAIPVGACSCVGMAGASLGGGIGFYSGMFGPMSDSLASVEMILADGTPVVVSDRENSDLWWAVKGAGANFGAVTSLTYRVYDSPNAGQVMSADMIFPASQNGSLWEFAKSWVGRQPTELSLTFSILFNQTSQRLNIITNVIYAGPLAKGQSIIKPLLQLKPETVNVSYLPWKDIPDTANLGGPGKSCLIKNQTTIPYSANLYQVDVKGLSAAINFLNGSVMATKSLQTTFVALTQYAPSGFQLNPSSSSAFPYRDVIMFAQVSGLVLDPRDTETVDSFGRNLRDRLQRTSGKKCLEVYTNFAHGDEGLAAWYREENVARLKQLKRKYDPNSLFSFYNSVA